MRLYLFRLGTVPGIGAPVPGYLVRTDDGAGVLIDTGPVPGGPITATSEEGLLAHLDRVGVAPPEIRYVVSTHLDPDHCGGHDLFPNAEFVIQREHLRVARAGEIPRLLIGKDRWAAPQVRYREVDGDTELLPGIELIESGGHTPGHQSVLVRLPETGPVLLAIDAIPNGAALNPQERPIFPFDVDAGEVRRSTAKLLALAEREGALVVRGHDAEQWAGLRHSPDCYR